MEKVVLERRKNTKYTVNFENKKYVWAGSKGTMANKKEVPSDLYDYLAMFTTCLKKGELVLVEKTDEDKERVEQLPDKDEYLANSLSKEKIIEILKSKSIKVMQTELNKVTADSTKRFVLEIAKEIKLENANKRLFIKEWLGSDLSTDELFTE